MDIRIIDITAPAYLEIVALRNEVLRKPLGLEITAAEITDDSNDIIIGAFDSGKIIGCVLLKKMDKNSFKLRAMCVSHSYRHRKIGTALVNFAEQTAKGKNIPHIVLDARKTAEPFYRQLGYESTGNVFIKVGIPHVFMQKHLNG